MPRKPPGTLSERLAHWLEASEPRLLRAGAGEGSAAERRLARAVLAEIRNSLSSESAGPPERLAGRDIARVARTTGALRDRTLALLARSRARDARSLARLAGRAFDALLTRHLSAPQKQNGKPAAGLSGPSLGSAGEAATRMILERVFEDSQQAVLVLDKHGRIIHANRALAAWYGYSPRRLRRMNVTELIAPPYRREFPRRVRKLLKDGDHQVFPALHVRRDGSHLNVQISAWLLPVDGQPWIVSILRDTTEKKRVERELKYVLSGAQCLIWQAAVTSRRGGFDWEMKPIDPAAGQAFLPLKLRRGEGYARAWHRARSDEDAARCRREVGDALRAGELAYSHEFRCVDARGRTRWIHEDIRAEPLRHRSWRLTGLCTDVTPRREAEEELRENVARFRKVFDEGPLGMAIIGLDFSFLSVNRTLCDMLGYTEREMEGLKFPDVTHPDDVDKDVSLAEKVFRGEIPHYAIEKRYLKKDGAVLWINLTASVIRDKDERPLYGLAMIEDITERRRASGELEERVRERTRALSASEEKFRTIFENAPILVDAFDENGRCTLWNRECERTLGWTRAEVLASEDPLALAYPDPAIRARILERISKGDGIFREYELGTRDGSKRIQLWANFRLPNGSFISTGLDITERKQAENALREARDALETRVEQRTAELSRAVEALEIEVSEKEKAEAELRDSESKLSALIENATEAIFSVDTAYRLITFNTYFSDGFQGAFGVPAEAGAKLDSLLAAEHLSAERAYLISQIDRALGGESFTVETSHRVRGTNRFYIVSYQPIGARGEVRGVTIYAKDITDLKTAERELAGRLEFETLIARVSQTFINGAPADLDSAIDDSLRRIGEFTNADRCRFFLFSRDRKRLVKIMEWCAGEVPPRSAEIERLPPDFIPRMASQLMGPEGVVLTDLRAPSDAPAAIRRVFVEEGIDSLVAVPLVTEGTQIGILGLHSVRRGRKWSAKVLPQLRIIGEIMAHAIGRARAQRALAELGRQNELILQSAGEGIYGLDTAGRATFVNPAAAAMIGWKAEDLIGRSMHEILHHSRADKSPYPPEECPIYAAFRGGSARSVDEELFWRKDGTSFPAEYTSTPIHEGGKILGAVVTFKDISERKRGEEALRRVVEGTSASVGEDFFRSLVQHLAAALGVRFAFLAECIAGDPSSARILAFWAGDEFGTCFEYPIAGTPCEEVFRGGESIYLSGVRERFPEDAWLREIGAESYRAVPLYDSRGTPLGHLGVLHDKPMSDAFSRDPILRIFAARAGAEVERKRTEEALVRQAEIEKIIGAISKRFIDVATGEIDGAIDDALRLIGTFSGADRSYLFRFSPDLREVDNSNVWHAEGVPLLVDPIRHARARNFPWALRKLEKFETMRIDRVADMPPEAASEKAEMEFRGIRSILGVPIVSRNQLMGFIGFSAIRTEWVWDDQTVRMLELLSETMANALARDRAEGKFKQLSHQNQLILSAAGEGIYGTDMEGRATFVNPAAARMCGWEAEELIGKPMHEILHHTRPDGTPHPMEECPIAETLRKGVVQRIDNELFWKKDGTAFPAEYIATPIREGGRISGVVITFNDITPRKRAEEFRYQAQLLSQVPDAVLVLGDRGEISFWSKGAEGLTGYAPDAVAGRSFDFILAEGDPGGGMAAISAHLSGMGPNQQYRGEHLIRRADGQTRLIALHLQPSPELEGRQPGWIGIAQDVTEARGIQEEMVQAQRLAEVGTLAAGVAHEINNPLTVLSGNIQLLLERGSGEDPERPRFEQMKKVCDRISNVVNALSRITAHGGEQWVFAGPNEVVEETLLLIEQLHAPKGVRLVRRYGRDLPNLRLLQNGLQQVMMNIVMNAIDAVEDDGEVIVETSRIDPPQAAEAGKSAAGASAGIGPKVCIRVTDTGHGIPNDALPRLFLPFFTTKEPGKGTGLGLAVARSIVSIHRGVIDVESRVGTGTTFTIVLPAS